MATQLRIYEIDKLLWKVRDILYFLCQAFIFRYYYKSLSIVKARPGTPINI